MKHGRTRRLAAVLIAALALTAGGCGKKVQQVPGLDALGSIQAITREDSSGTRAAFDDLAGIDSEAQTLTGAGSTAEVLQEVAGSGSAIGYLTLSSADSTVRVLSVDGRSPEDPKYPLVRTLYLAYKGEPDDLEREFLTYVTGSGQSIVGRQFETVGSEETFLSLKPGGTLRIGGSSSEAPVMEELAQAYMQLNPNADITVETTDSGTGINSALSGDYDLGMCSRNPKDYEKTLLTFVPVAKDRIAVIVQEGHPLSDITTGQLQEIYSGKITEWKQLNGE